MTTTGIIVAVCVAIVAFWFGREWGRLDAMRDEVRGRR